ncbi:hypothetical protein C5167_038887 [Papaver somniferum]|uniref:F-box domain-containing protein n=1 Tax=Papaver somniferum TaxID=3469 RepID=A0A4Y7IEW5_PAPSO|nr:hypothetical protein C5167_038887 [Papaver somniferum]
MSYLCSEVDEIDHFDRLPDSLLLIVFNQIGDVKALGRCCVVSRRFHELVPQIDNVVVRVDCVISDDDASATAASSDKTRSVFSNLIRLVFGGIFKPLQALGQFLGPRKSSPSSSSSSTSSSSSISGGVGGNGGNGTLINDDEEMESGGVTHHSPTQVLKNFNEIRRLRIELPSGELGIDDGVLLKWRADFGSTLDNCLILGASSIIDPPKPASAFSLLQENLLHGGAAAAAAASAAIEDDGNGQGVLCMNKEQLEELRVKPLSASTASKRTLVPALNMRLWYAPQLELPDGSVLKGATLVAIRPTEQTSAKKEVSDVSWVSNAFEEPYGTAAKLLVKRNGSRKRGIWVIRQAEKKRHSYVTG